MPIDTDTATPPAGWREFDPATRVGDAPPIEEEVWVWVRSNDPALDPTAGFGASATGMFDGETPTWVYEDGGVHREVGGATRFWQPIVPPQEPPAGERFVPEGTEWY